MTRPSVVTRRRAAQSAGAPGQIPRIEPAGTWAPDRARIGPVELRRRLWHIAPGLLPILSWAIPHEDPLSITFQIIAAAIIIGIAAALVSRYHTVVRRGERNWGPAVLGYAGAVLGMLLLFPSSAELGMTVLVVLAFGDGTATLCGLYFRGRPLPWNPHKTWAGLAGFIAAGLPLSVLAYLAESQPTAPFVAALGCGAAATFAAAIAESLDMRLNDNIRVGLAASLAVLCAHQMLVG